MGIEGTGLVLPVECVLDHTLRVLRTTPPNSNSFGAGDSLEDFLGDSPDDSLVGRSLWEIVAPGPLRQALAGAIRHALSHNNATAQTQLPSGETLRILVETTPDGFALRQLAEKQAASEPPIADDDAAERYFRDAEDLLCVLGADGEIQRANPAWKRLLNLSADELTGRFLTDLAEPASAGAIRDALLAAREALPGSDSAARFSCRLRDPRARNFLLQFTAIAGRIPGTLYAAARAVAAPLAQPAPAASPTVAPSPANVAPAPAKIPGERDLLTRLPDRQAIEDEISRRLTRSGGPFTVLFLDVDRFHPINEALGYSVGDEVLRLVARRIETAIGANDCVARIGSDEFIAVLDRIETPSDAREAAERIRHELEAPCRIAGTDLYLTACIGIAIGPRDGADSRTLMRHASRAMQAAKTVGRGACLLFDPSMRGIDSALLSLEGRLGYAMNRGEMLLYYQPQVSAASGKLAGFEALARWRHTELGLVSPTTFIPLAEQSGLIIPMGNWVLNDACRQISAWNGSASNLHMSVNLSPKQLTDSELPERVERILAETSMIPERLDLELTESTFLKDGDRARDVLLRLKTLGIRLSVDDFGTGYSSLAYLSRLPVDRVKIDRSFVTNLMRSSADTAVVRAIIDLAHTLGMKVVAEGVETVEQSDALVALGCDFLQGYLFGKPQPAIDAQRLLPSHT